MSFPLTTEKANPFSRNGWLEIPFFADNPIPKTGSMADRKYSEDEINIIRRVDEIAKRRKWSMRQVSLAWICQRPGVISPRVEINSIEILKDVTDIRGKSLTKDEMKYLEDLYVPLPTA